MPPYFTHGDYDALSHLVSPTQVEVHRYPKSGPARPAIAYVPGSKKNFENYAFDRLYAHRKALGIEALFCCKNARTDGILQLDDAEPQSDVILLEIKTTLSWASLNTAMGQFISGTALLRKAQEISGAKQGLIVFESFSSDWVRGHEDFLRPWAILYRHLIEMEAGFQMAALQLCEGKFYNPFLHDAAIPGKISRLFRPYL
jgi:hypothetical protein